MRLEPYVTGRRRQRGTTLVEVLVSVAVLGIGLFGVAALQAAALRNNHSAHSRSEAVIYAYSILEAMRANRAAALAGNYDLVLANDPGTGASVAEQDLRWWRAELAQRLAAGTGAIDCATAPPVCEVTVQWDDSRATGGSATQQVVIRTRV